MWMMKVRADRVVDVIAVRDALVTAAASMFVTGSVIRALMIRRAGGGIGLSDGHLMLVDVTAMEVVQMSVMHVVGMPLVLDRGVPASLSVRV
jgi:hypothetical protein